MSDTDPCVWVVFVCEPGVPESIAGEVTAVTFEEAWEQAVDKYGRFVNHVQTKKT